MKPSRTTRIAWGLIGTLLALVVYVVADNWGSSWFGRASAPTTNHVSKEGHAAQIERGQYLARAGNCIACHSGPNFTDNGFHNLGLASWGVAEPDMLPAVLLGALLSAAVTLPMSLPLSATPHDLSLLALLGVFFISTMQAPSGEQADVLTAVKSGASGKVVVETTNTTPTAFTIGQALTASSADGDAIRIASLR